MLILTCFSFPRKSYFDFLKKSLQFPSVPIFSPQHTLNQVDHLRSTEFEIGVVIVTPKNYDTERCLCSSCRASERPISAEEIYPTCSCDTEEEAICPVPPFTADLCCCKSSMVEALRLLCGNTLSSLVDFNAFFFLTDALAIGSPLVSCADTDNISTPCASLRRFAPCNCDLLDVTGTAYFAIPGTTSAALDAVTQLSLCAIKAVAFQVIDSECPRDCDDSNFRRAVRALRRAIQAEGGTTTSCASCQSHCDCDDCCCAAGLLAELSTRNLSRLATLTVGPLILRNVTVLGSIGSVLVLADEQLCRFYLVCANTVEALG